MDVGYISLQGRMTSSHQNNASEPVNLALNYGCGFLEGEVRKAINAVGLEASVGFLHDFSDYQTKQSLVYDLQEPFRWLIDASVIEVFESRTLDLADFYFVGDDYRYRFEACARQRFIDVLRERFNAGVIDKGRVLKWDTVIEHKTNELGRFLTEKSMSVDFSKPAPRLKKQDDCKLRAEILALTASQAKQVDIGGSTLHCLHKRARCRELFRVHWKTRERLATRTL
jgi:CRISPR-associated protein Cas1